MDIYVLNPVKTDILVSTPVTTDIYVLTPVTTNIYVLTPVTTDIYVLTPVTTNILVTGHSRYCIFKLIQTQGIYFFIPDFMSFSYGCSSDIISKLLCNIL